SAGAQGAVTVVGGGGGGGGTEPVVEPPRPPRVCRDHVCLICWDPRAGTGQVIL
ncbi:ASCC2 isoform 19, partial [Pongo abelii]